jgi:(p)ppGpp synthase/HD superfamily hydrolase
MNLTEKIIRAISFASIKHEQQRRKGGRHIPYINHPIEVVRLLWEVGKVREEDVLLAGILHDTIEDTHTTPEELEEAFGKNVRELVQEVSDDKSLSKAERKRLQIIHAPHKSDGAKQIKLADKCANLYDIIHSPPDWSIERKMEYFWWAISVVDGLRGANQALEDRFDELVNLGNKTFTKESV